MSTVPNIVPRERVQATEQVAPSRDSNKDLINLLSMVTLIMASTDTRLKQTKLFQEISGQLMEFVMNPANHGVVAGIKNEVDSALAKLNK